jgi:hypothetical protein
MALSSGSIVAQGSVVLITNSIFPLAGIILLAVVHQIAKKLIEPAQGYFAT